MMEQTASEGISRLFEWGGIVTILVLVAMGLTFLCWYLIQRNMKLSDRFADVVQKNTEAFIELREAIRNAAR